MIVHSQTFGHQIIKPVLMLLGETSHEAIALLLTTAILESDLNILPVNSGADQYGIYQLTADMHQRTWDTALAADPDSASIVRGLASQRSFLEQPHLELTSNLSYATAIVWFYYSLSVNGLISNYPTKKISTIWCKLFHHPSSDENLDKFSHLYSSFLQTLQQAA